MTNSQTVEWPDSIDAFSLTEILQQEHIKMGKEQLQALVDVLQAQLGGGPDSLVIGTWVIQYDKKKQAFQFDKCEFGDYCEERPAVISLAGEVLDKGGPIFVES